MMEKCQICNDTIRLNAETQEQNEWLNKRVAWLGTQYEAQKAKLELAQVAIDLAAVQARDETEAEYTGRLERAEVALTHASLEVIDWQSAAGKAEERLVEVEAEFNHEFDERSKLLKRVVEVEAALKQAYEMAYELTLPSRVAVEEMAPFARDLFRHLRPEVEAIEVVLAKALESAKSEVVNCGPPRCPECGKLFKWEGQCWWCPECKTYQDVKSETPETK